jgi:peptide/nickel transport system permease protein
MRASGLKFGILIVVAIVALGAFASILAPFDPYQINPALRTKLPNEANLLGTDYVGRDVLSRVIYGARVSLAVGFAVAAIGTVIGTCIGLFVGFSRTADMIVMRIIDAQMAIPTILLAVGAMAISSPSLTNVILIISVAELPRIVRLVRAQTLSVKERPFVEAAVSYGVGPVRLIFRHILPSVLAPLTVQATYICGVAILAESSLSFLGIGVPPSIPSWGNVMAEGRNFWQIRPMLIAAPAVMLCILILGINLIGDALRDRFDPKARQ